MLSLGGESNTCSLITAPEPEGPCSPPHTSRPQCVQPGCRSNQRGPGSTPHCRERPCVPGGLQHGHHGATQPQVIPRAHPVAVLLSLLPPSCCSRGLERVMPAQARCHPTCPILLPSPTVLLLPAHSFMGIRGTLCDTRFSCVQFHPQQSTHPWGSSMLLMANTE